MRDVEVVLPGLCPVLLPNHPAPQAGQPVLKAERQQVGPKAPPQRGERTVPRQVRPDDNGPGTVHLVGALVVEWEDLLLDGHAGRGIAPEDIRGGLHLMRPHGNG
jgi:hypothetical protein